MAYLIHSINDAVRSVQSLTGLVDANPGQAAISDQGDIYVMTNMGWMQVWDHTNGINFTPTYPLPTNKAVVQDGQTLTVATGTVTLNVVNHNVTATYTAT
jgi:hypothetical protein